ncbi:UNVERIFIED_ORG: hypothetical protein J3D58_000589 [Paenarthrobacter nicotinovorans]
MRTLSLWDFPVRVRFPRVDQVRELDAVLNEEDRNVISHQVVGTLVRVELRGEATGVTDRISGPPGSQTVENLTNTGVSTSGARNPALVIFEAVP